MPLLRLKHITYVDDKEMLTGNNWQQQQYHARKYLNIAAKLFAKKAK